MANIKDMSDAINCALEEIGVTGQLAINMDGDQMTAPIGQSGGDDLRVAVDIQDMPAIQPIRHDQGWQFRGEKR